jgi:hypothetical protein
VAQLINNNGGGVPTQFWEFVPPAGDSPSYKCAQDSSQTMREVMINPGTFANWENAKLNLLGYNRLVVGPNLSGNPARYINRALPSPYPALASPVNLQGKPYMRANSIPMTEGLGVGRWNAAVGVTEYDRMRIHLVYDSFPYDFREDNEVLGTQAQGTPLTGLPDEGAWLETNGWTATRFISRNWEPAGRMITLRDSYLVFLSDLSQSLQQFAYNQLDYDRLIVGTPPNLGGIDPPFASADVSSLFRPDQS